MHIKNQNLFHAPCKTKYQGKMYCCCASLNVSQSFPSFKYFHVKINGKKKIIVSGWFRSVMLKFTKLH